MKDFKTIVVAYGDGIGPEIMEATLLILKEAGARLNIETIEIGEKLYLKGMTSGISPEAWDKVMKHRVLLKAPITTPQGKGYKSLNVTFRKALGLYANIRPCASYYPFAGSVDSKMDMVICRENEEDLYAGVEYKPGRGTAISHKLITKGGSEKIVRYAFEYARNNGRKKVTCLIKDNIMKIADGIFHTAFKSIAEQYPEIAHDSIIVDIGSARIASRPSDFDVVVTLNLYGDIISDIAAEVSGSVGLAGSANIGDDFGMFEAVHGSAPDIAGRGIANPSGLLNGAILMLENIGQPDIAGAIKNAWLATLESGVHTADIYREGASKQKAGTMDFARAVISNLGRQPAVLSKYALQQSTTKASRQAEVAEKISTKQLIGMDVVLDISNKRLDDVVKALENVHKDFKLHLIASRGLKIWPGGRGQAANLEIVSCRFIGYADTGVTQQMAADLLQAVVMASFDVTATHSLYTYDGEIGFTKAQGE